MKIYLVRHAVFNNPGNVFPFHLPLYLTPEGRAKATRVGEWLVSQSVKGVPIVTSPIVRCVQTAEIIAGFTKSDVTLDERLIEVANPALQGKPMVGDHWKTEESDPDTETHDEIKKRMLAWYDGAVSGGGDVIGVSHGTPLMMLYLTLTNQLVPEHMWYPANEQNNIQRGEVAVLTIENKQVVSHERINL